MPISLCFCIRQQNMSYFQSLKGALPNSPSVELTPVHPSNLRFPSLPWENLPGPLLSAVSLVCAPSALPFSMFPSQRTDLIKWVCNKKWPIPGKFCVIFKSTFSFIQLFLAFHFHRFRNSSTASFTCVLACGAWSEKKCSHACRLRVRMIKRHKLKRTGMRWVGRCSASATVSKGPPYTDRTVVRSVTTTVPPFLPPRPLHQPPTVFNPFTLSLQAMILLNMANKYQAVSSTFSWKATEMTVNDFERGGELGVGGHKHCRKSRVHGVEIN